MIIDSMTGHGKSVTVKQKALKMFFEQKKVYIFSDKCK